MTIRFFTLGWRWRCGLLAAAAWALLWGAAWSRDASDRTVAIPAPVRDETPATGHDETAVFAGGCFWGVQGVFQHVKGVTDAVAGYTGGAARDASYAAVSGGNTGHAESVAVTFDPTRISYGALLHIFFSVVHDPTEHDRQGPDYGSQYRSAVFPQTEAQRQVAQAYIQQLNASHLFSAPLATTVETGALFYPAEAYHQNYLADHPQAPYIVINDLPKLAQLRQGFPNRYRRDPVLVRVRQNGDVIPAP
ncbi:peptide-methionine (S)-S-oxide reductase MsrA [Martelella alba]|uniref:Peptide methionine sulfoxide reductase MsrA n=1 Tax=Martelella alba TaxID=2590451 RepID=A0ABY2SNE4_9HYPH|nr:peptide-methionine (S)-S-oxide reductase MsrA [Martelella alba]TKI06590.1 peptide-methionine (S)-S-oxide reductase MsrA [Martelella alba]